MDGSGKVSVVGRVVGGVFPAENVCPDMKVRGERECRECGTRWSYYETGSVDCPSCGSIHSVGVDERTEHTDTARNLDLTAAREAVDDGRPLRETLELAKDACREYVRAAGFVHAGELRDLDSSYLAATELLHAADLVGRSFAPDDTEELYVLDLLRGADHGERPDTGDVPESLREARGMAAADAVRDYRDDIRTSLDGTPDRPASDVLELLGQHERRVRALGGDVPPASADRLVAATRSLGRHLGDDEETALAEARDRLDRLET